MARTPDWEQLEMAAGDPRPAWPLPGVVPKFATWSLGGGRPFGCTLESCKRWHAGIDLTGAPDGSIILAPEDALVVGIDRGWDDAAKAAFLRTGTGLFLVLGGFRQGSHREFGVTHGQQVKKGENLGRIHGPYGMLHVETYQADSRTTNSVWWKTEPPPKGLLNPTHYVERMVGDKVSLLQTRQRHEALAALGYYKGDPAAAWGPASTDALRTAQAALGIAVDGKWGPQTEDAIHKALAESHGCAKGECETSLEADETPSTPSPGSTTTDVLAPLGKAGWFVLGSLALASVGVGLALTLRRDG